MPHEKVFFRKRSAVPYYRQHIETVLARVGRDSRIDFQRIKVIPAIPSKSASSVQGGYPQKCSSRPRLLNRRVNHERHKRHETSQRSDKRYGLSIAACFHIFRVIRVFRGCSFPPPPCNAGPRIPARPISFDRCLTPSLTPSISCISCVSCVSWRIPAPVVRCCRHRRCRHHESRWGQACSMRHSLDLRRRCRCLGEMEPSCLRLCHDGPIMAGPNNNRSHQRGAMVLVQVAFELLQDDDNEQADQQHGPAQRELAASETEPHDRYEPEGGRRRHPRNQRTAAEDCAWHGSCKT